MRKEKDKLIGKKVMANCDVIDITARIIFKKGEFYFIQKTKKDWWQLAKTKTGKPIFGWWENCIFWIIN